MSDIPVYAQLIVLAVPLALSAVFSIAETSMMALNRIRAKALAAQGRRGAPWKSCRRRTSVCVPCGCARALRGVESGAAVGLTDYAIVISGRPPLRLFIEGREMARHLATIRAPLSRAMHAPAPNTSL